MWSRNQRVDPPLETEPERVPLTDEHRKGILDPMTASLLTTPGAGNPLAPEACQRTVAIFDGRMRYDLRLAFKRMDHVKADKGYAGPVVVCAVYFTPIAGYIPMRSAIRYLAKQRDIEAWLAPIAGTRVLVPFRVAGADADRPHGVGGDAIRVRAASPRRASVNWREDAVIRHPETDSGLTLRAEESSLSALTFGTAKRPLNRPVRYPILWGSRNALPDIAVNEVIQRRSQRFGRGSFQTRSKA